MLITEPLVDGEGRHYSDPLIKAYFERVGRVFGDIAPYCRKCGLDGSGIAVRWQDGKMQLTCTRCRFEWFERPQDDVPYAERNWKLALALRATYHPFSRALKWAGLDNAEQKAKDEARYAEETAKVDVAEAAFKRWIAENVSDLNVGPKAGQDTVTVVTVTAAQHGVMNPDGTWTVEEWEADP